jgi:hypothetical protein
MFGLTLAFLERLGQFAATAGAAGTTKRNDPRPDWSGVFVCPECLGSGRLYWEVGDCIEVSACCYCETRGWVR